MTVIKYTEPLAVGQDEPSFMKCKVHPDEVLVAHLEAGKYGCPACGLKNGWLIKPSKEGK